MGIELKKLLFAIGRPFGPFYGLAMKLRSLCYEKDLFKAVRLPIPVVSIGNLTMGGTGKTPHVMSLCQWLISKGLRPCVISRGYASSAGKGPVVVSKGDGPIVDVSHAGDEPYMMAKSLAMVPIVVGSDRAWACQYAIKRFSPKLIVLDDGFQHLRIKRDVDIVLFAAKRPLGNNRVFPGGELRESLSALKRATTVLITKAEGLSTVDVSKATDAIRPFFRGPVFISQNRITSITRLFPPDETPTDIRGKKVLAFCGLGDPESFRATLQVEGAVVLGYRWFRDHHRYQQHDLLPICSQAQQVGANALVTTEKDAVKLRDLNLNTLGIEILVVGITPVVQQGFWSYLEERLVPLINRDGRGGGI